jgi:hypothetical protein
MGGEDYRRVIQGHSRRGEKEHHLRPPEGAELAVERARGDDVLSGGIIQAEKERLPSAAAGDFVERHNGSPPGLLNSANSEQFRKKPDDSLGWMRR